MLVPPLRQTFLEVAEESEAQAAQLELRAMKDPQRARHLRAYANHHRKLADTARKLAEDLRY